VDAVLQRVEAVAKGVSEQQLQQVCEFVCMQCV